MSRRTSSQTPSQTVGPFYHFSLTTNPALGCLTTDATQGERIRLRLRILDGDGAPIPDAMIELWQADAAGKYDHPADPQSQVPDPAFRGFGRLPTDADGTCIFETIRPGRVPDGHGNLQAPHINVSVFARGLLDRLCTRVYFENDGNDPVLAIVPEDRRQTLIARHHDTSEWRIDIHLQGEQETVFFEV